jgi:uncharacterized protein
MSGISVSTLWTEASPPVGVAAIAHGAGADMRHPFMTGLAEGLTAGGFSVLRFNFPYMDAGRRRPDPPPVLLETWDAALLEAVRRAGGLPVVAGGKSMGGRIVSMLAAARGREFPATALAFFGYPLHPPGKPDLLRDAHLPQVRIPMLFLQGSNDALARLDLIEALVKRLHPLADLHVVEGGDHSFRRRAARSSDQANARGVAQIAGRHIRQILERAP